MKINQLLLIGTLLLALLAVAQSTNTCGTNPLLPVIKRFISEQNEFVDGKKAKPDKDSNPHDKKAKELKFSLTDITSIETATPSVQTGLGLCNQSDGELSCCTRTNVQAFKKLTKGYFFKKAGKKPNPYKIIRAMGRKVKKSKCLSKEEFKPIQNEIIKAKAVKDSFKELRKCQRKAIFSQASLIRGTICQVCIDPSLQDSLFDGEGEQLKLKVTPGNMGAYNTAITTAFTCAETANGNFRTALKTLISKLGSGCQTVIDEIKAEIDRNIISAPTNCKTSATFFGDGCLGQLQDGEDGEESSGRRMLSSTGNYIEDANGASGAFEEDPAEQQELDAIEDPADDEFEGDDGNGDGNSTGGESSASLLSLSFGLVCLLAFLI